MTSDADIESFFREKTIFITGATGFVGKVLVEKLLRCCPGTSDITLKYPFCGSVEFIVYLDIAQIHILVRQKRDATPSQRITELCSSPV